MSILAKLGYNIAGRTVVRLGRRILRENKIKKKAYNEGFEDAKAGKPPRYN